MRLRPYRDPCRRGCAEECRWLVEIQQSSGGRDEPVLIATRAQSGRVVSLGRGSPSESRGRGQADLSVGRLLDLPLVPRNGAASLFRPRDRGADERQLYQHQGRSGGAARHRPHLHAGDPVDYPARRLAQFGVFDAKPRAVFCRHLLSAQSPARAAFLSPSLGLHAPALARPARAGAPNCGPLDRGHSRLGIRAGDRGRAARFLARSPSTSRYSGALRRDQRRLRGSTQISPELALGAADGQGRAVCRSLSTAHRLALAGADGRGWHLRPNRRGLSPLRYGC